MPPYEGDLFVVQSSEQTLRCQIACGQFAIFCQARIFTFNNKTNLLLESCLAQL